MIHSTSSSDRTVRAEALAPSSSKPALRGPGSDHFTAQHSAALMAALAAQPEIRPEVVARGQALAADPSYPSPEVMRGIAAQILRAPDLSEDAS